MHAVTVVEGSTARSRQVLQQLLPVRSALTQCVRSYGNEGAQRSLGKARNVGVGARGSHVTFPLGSFIFRHRCWKVRDQGRGADAVQSRSKL